MMSSIFVLGEELELKVQELQSILEDGWTSDSPEFQLKLREMVACEGDFKDKAVRIGYVIKRSKADIETIDAELERLTKIKKQRQTTIENLTSITLNHMLSLGIESATDGLTTLSTCIGKWSVDVENAESLPSEYQRIKTTIEPNKVLLLANRESLQDVQGVKFKQGYSLKIA
jgi:hypothetical protein